MIHLPIIIVILAGSRISSAQKAYLFAFGLGLLADLILGNQLGLLAGSYLLATAVVFIYKSRFRFNWFSLGIFLILSQIIFFYARGLVK